VAKKRKRKPKEPVSTVDYADAEGNVLTLRESLGSKTIEKIASERASGGGTAEDDWQRRTELLFERLAVRWEIAGMPITEQKMLLGRYRMADAGTREWVRHTIAEHARGHIPELE
jgi:hypothetical protein